MSKQNFPGERIQTSMIHENRFYMAAQPIAQPEEQEEEKTQP